MRGLANFITLLGMVAATTAALVAARGEHSLAILLMLAAVAADFCDGKIARLGGEPNKFGKQLDKTADFYNFALMGGAVLWLWHPEPWLALGWAVFALGCARRTGQPQPEDHFVGMPIPLAWCWAAMPALLDTGEHRWLSLGDYGRGLPAASFMLIAAALMLSRREFRKLEADDAKPIGLILAASVAAGLLASNLFMGVITAVVLITAYCLIEPRRAQ